MDHPTFVRLEYNYGSGWQHGHGGINLMNPKKYIDKLALKNGMTNARAIDDDDNVYTKILEELSLCEHCEEEHAPPFDGMCLLG